MDQEAELELIEKAVKGSDEAFTALFQHNYAFLFHYLIKLSLDPDLTEDLIQETMLKAYVHLPGFKKEAKFSSWLIAIASRLYLDQQRKRKRERKRFEKAKEEAIRKMRWNVMNSGFEWTDLMDQFAVLDPAVRLPVLLKHYYEFTYEEIAVMLGLKEGTVKSRVHNGIKQIRKELSQYE